MTNGGHLFVPHDDARTFIKPEQLAQYDANVAYWMKVGEKRFARGYPEEL